MVKRAASFGLTLAARGPRTSRRDWLYNALRAAILHGQLRPGTRLPSTRELASQYGVSRGTVVDAFAQLTSEGYVVGTVGSGTHVNAVLPDDLLQLAAQARAGATAPQRRPRRMSRYARRVVGFRQPAHPTSRAFRPNVPALDQFPTTLWAQLASRRLRRASAHVLAGCGPTGYAPLREAIADYLASSRGVTCRPEQVVIVSGVQEAIDVVARLVLNPGDSVCMEDPGYPGAFRLLEAVGARVTRARVDGDGMQLGASALRGVRLVYVTPAHQCPLGVAMTLPRRLALLAWARKTGALVLEDDYDSEFRYTGRPLPALQGLDRGGQVVLAGSFSKVLFPSLRLGYLVVPSDLIDRITAARSLTSRHPPMLEQMVACDFITEGHFGRHLRRMRQLYAERLAVVVDGARQHLTGSLEISSIEAGLHTIGWLHGGITGEEVAEAVAARGVEVIPLRRFYRGAMPRDGLQLGFAAVNARELRRGITELARVLERMRAGAR